MMNQETRKLVYHSHIASHLQYGLILWGNSANKEQLNKLQREQTKCLQIVQLNKHQDPHKNLGIPSITDMIKLENMKFGYKLIHHMLPIKIIEACLTDNKHQSLTKTHPYSTRNKKVPNLPSRMNKQYRDSFLYKGPQSWLALSVETKEKPNLKSFIKTCKRNLITA